MKPRPRHHWSTQWTTVTPISKAIALILLVALPFIGFYLGMKFEQLRNPRLMDVNVSSLK